MVKTHITDVTLRDAHQCLIATRLRTEDMLPACGLMDRVGYWAMEVWGGATFDSCIRFLKEDPWDRLRSLRNALPNTPISMLLRGQNLLGYRNYADDVVKNFIKLAVNNGVDVFRVFDALNDSRNIKLAVETIKHYKKHAQGAICYTTSPVHTLESFIALGRELADMGCESLAIKDMAGLLIPSVAVELVKGLSSETGLPIHLHSHSTSGLASICHYEAILAGCQHIDTAISSFSGGASHPPTEPMVVALAGSKYDTQLDLNLLLDINDYFKKVRKKYEQFETDARDIDPRVQFYQIPGGMISNLYSQLKEQNALDKIDLVHKEIPKVRKDLGYPPLVTPTSQVVGSQAVLNILAGERYKIITNEVKLYCQGKYGEPPGKINPSLRRKAIGSTEFIDVRPADLLPYELKQLKKEIGSLAQSEEDVLTYSMFPEIGRQFLEQRKQNALKPEPLLNTGNASKNQDYSEFDISLHGEQYHIKIGGQGVSAKNEEFYYLWVDGVPEEVLVYHRGTEEKNQNTIAKKISDIGDVKVGIPGVIIEIMVKTGDKVRKGQPLFLLEAMKMETEILAPIEGVVTEIFCEKGDKMSPEQIVLKITDNRVNDSV